MVAGPDRFGIEAALAPWPTIKYVECGRRNVSQSRNIGIRAASGEFVAFIDDDAIPDPAWLTDLLAGFETREVAATGGPVFDHTGGALQVWMSYCSRAGVVSSVPPTVPDMSNALSSPYSWRIPSSVGTNSCFRREALVAIGGFDEEFDYYLDETDVCLRLVEAGHRISLLSTGFVYHQFLPSDIRNHHRVVDDWASILKNVCYFGCTHGVPVRGIARVAAEIEAWAAGQREQVARWSADGLVDPRAVERFDASLKEDGDRGWRRGLERAPRVRDPAWFTPHTPFSAFAGGAQAARRLHVCLVSRAFESEPPGGIARVTRSMASGLADRGHVVRVLTEGDDRLEVDWDDDGYWLHRLPPDHVHRGADSEHAADVWAFASAAAREVDRIDAVRVVDVVQVPNWDSEGIEIIRANRWPTSLGLYTPLRTVVSNDHRLSATDPTVETLVRMEDRCTADATVLLACGPAIAAEIAGAVDPGIAEDRVRYIPHGLPDTRLEDEGRAASDGTVGFLFVGRLEPRKGVDVLIAAYDLISATSPHMKVTLVGGDTEIGHGRDTYDERIGTARRSLRFAGALSEQALAKAYHEADVVVVPSLFESFGLTAVEAMIHGKPVIASDVGGLAEIVVAESTGILVPPSDPRALAEAMVRLASDPELRSAMGRAGRQRYEHEYSLQVMSERLEEHYLHLVAAGIPDR